MKNSRPRALWLFVVLALSQRATTSQPPTDETTNANTTINEDDQTNGTINKDDQTNSTIKEDDQTNGTINKDDQTNGTINKDDQTNGTINEDELSEHFRNCTFHVEFSEYDGETRRFERLANGSVHFLTISHTLNRTDFIPNPANASTIFVCQDLMDMFDTMLRKFPLDFTTVTLVGTGLSAVCIGLHVAMFLSFKKLRNLPGYTLFSLCVALLAAYACVFVEHALPRDAECTEVGIVKAYFFLAAFLWMNVMSFDIWRSLRMATAKLQLTADRGLKRRLAAYSAYAWGAPLVVLALGAVVHHSPGANERYRMDINPLTCWFRHRNALLAYFAAPIFATIAANVALFVASFAMIRAVGGGDLGEQRSRLVVSVRLSVAMGLVWVFAVLANYTAQLWLSYVAVLFTVLQGVFIFFSFSFTDKIKKEVRRAVQRRKDSSYPTQTSMHQMSSSA